jgi:hypothetical protein
MEKAISTNEKPTEDKFPDPIIPESLSEQTAPAREEREVDSQKTYGLKRFMGGAVISTNFTPVIMLKNITIYISNGTTPNGNLSGKAGDICFGADAGKAYKCTSTTTWVSFT